MDTILPGPLRSVLGGDDAPRAVGRDNPAGAGSAAGGGPTRPGPSGTGDRPVYDAGNASSGAVLRGRRDECAVLDAVVADVRDGRSRVLVLTGEAGIGKTSLLEHLAGRATGCRLARATGVESEMEFAFAGLHQLCAPFLGRLDRLPAPQREALSTAFGLLDGAVPDRFLVSLAVLNLLSDAAEDQPLICLVDDAQWLDQASLRALTFVARRLLAEPIAVVFATRTVAADPVLPLLPSLLVTGLAEHDARAMLLGVLHGPLEAAVLDEILAEARGNPLALVELPRGRTGAELAFGFGRPGSMPVAGRVEQGFLHQLEPLPAATRRLLLVAAVEPVGDVTLLWRAAELLDVGPPAATPAESAGLIEIGARVRFRHPLLRSAVCRAADIRDLRRVHDALARAGTDPDRTAWHRAQACAVPDEEVAAELARSAERARARGGLAAAGAFLQRAAELTPSARLRAERLLAAAAAKLEGGQFESVTDLLAACAAEPGDELRSARIDLLRARFAFAFRRTSRAVPLLRSAADRMVPLDAEMACNTYLDAFNAAIFSGRLSGGANVAEVADAVRKAPRDLTRQPDLLLESMATLFTDGYSAAVPLVRRALAGFRTAGGDGAGESRWLFLAASLAADTWDDESWDVVSERQVRIARDGGALTELPLAINSRIVLLLFAGELATAEHLVAEAQAVGEAIGADIAPYGAFALAAWRGRADELRGLADTAIDGMLFRGEGIGVGQARWASALLFNGLGRYDEAVVAAREASEHLYELGVSKWGLVELVEAAVRSGETDLARQALTTLEQVCQASGTRWARGLAARSRAMLSDGSVADELYREAIGHLRRTRLPLELARARLLYGEWLRREGRRVDAREQLRAAYERFASAGAQGFAERARRELLVTGESARRRGSDGSEELTAQELQIARLAAERRTNPEIGAYLYISPRTVEWHLGKIFTKLGIGSRRELASALPDLGTDSASA
ncbi:AAA family ATPase [Actinocatenispora sera]|uniref:helix-turn-helix transcriptional regulator n=1 Tax=Actinocatenispora sera TaxID=390989 RepID=UPI0033D96E0B